MYTPRTLNSGLGLAMMLVLAFAHNTQAQVSSWTAGAGLTDFGSAANWTQGIPDGSSIAAIGPDANAQNSDVLLDNDRNLGALLITDGMYLRTNVNDLSVGNLNGGGLTIAGSNVLQDNSIRRSRLIVDGGGGPGGTLTADGNLRVLDGAALQLNNGVQVRVTEGFSLTNSVNSLILGDGNVSLQDEGQQTLNNNGTISVRGLGQFTLQSNGIADFDGDNETGILDANAALSRLTLQAETNESFDGAIRIGSGSTVEFESDGGGWSFGTANVEFNAVNANVASRLSYSDESFVSGTNFQVNGHGVIGQENDTGSSLTGTAHLNLAADTSLRFENTEASLTGTWTVGDNAVLDFQDRLISANSVAVVLNGGSIKGEGSSIFNNTDQQGIRGHGRFELHVNNTTGITADGGELEIVGTEDIFDNNDNIDWDGSFNTGALRAEAGDLRLVDRFSGTTQGDVRLGGGHTLHVDGFTMQFNGNVRLNGGTVKSEDAQLFRGSVDVTRESTMDTFAGFQDGVEVDLQADLHLKGHASFIDNTATIFGIGDLINESDNRLTLDGGSFVDVDVINHGLIRNENVESPGIISIGGRLDNFGTIVFGLGGADDLTHFDIQDELLADGGIFQVSLVNDFDPMLGDEFDFLDFGSFTDNGFSYDLPDLQQGLVWDSSDFTSQGILRISTAVPEPSGALLLAIGVLGLAVRRRRRYKR